MVGKIVEQVKPTSIMKKIMFSTEYGLQQGAIARTKTKTRRADKRLNHPLVTEISDWGIDDKGKCYLAITYSTGLTEAVYPAYQIGEEVAVAQSYKTLIEQGYLCRESDGWVSEECVTSPGYSNKMFVRADLMPHRIRITDIKVERLQDISDEDCLKEGLIAGEQEPRMFGFRLLKGTILSFLTPRAAFAALIDKVSGKGTWERNPWVFVYEFELVK